MRAVRDEIMGGGGLVPKSTIANSVVFFTFVVPRMQKRKFG
jgi:hypothetical protein